ncbi:MAG: hypothetical protein LBK47_02595 [Prevotellaceae bacterium]|jgi:hypothetical protein|nr:hypothetical protein [Prevotellaceae bacterium]
MRKELDADIESCLKIFLNAHYSTLEKLVMSEHYWLACGSTKTSIETALCGCSGQINKMPVVMDYYSPILQGKLVIGLTYSGNSTEVTDFIPVNTHPDSKIITSSSRVIEKTVLPFITKGIPLRYLPLLTHKLIRSIYNQDVSKHTLSGDLRISLEPVFEALRFSYINNLIPVFTSDNNSWFARLFSEQHMEFLKRPAFSVSYPNYTHNFLWSLSKHNIDRFYFIHENSQFHYSDCRQSKAIKHISLLGGFQAELPFNTTSYDVYAIWLSCISLYEKLSTMLDLNMNAEHSFNE